MRQHFCVCPTCGAHLDFGEVCTDCLIGADMLRTNAATGGSENKKGPTSCAGKQEDVEPTDSLEGLLVPLYHGALLECKEERQNDVVRICGAHRL